MTEIDDAAQRVAELAGDRDLQVATAESLTAGAIASALGRSQGSAGWLAGGVVAYAPRVKFDVLGVSEGPLVTERCAREMAVGVVGLLGADVAVSATGVGGPDPDPEEGEPAGAVYLAAASRTGEVDVRRLDLDGSPGEIVEQTVTHALALLADLVERTTAPASVD